MFLLEETNELFNSFSAKVFEEGALSKKDKEIIALTVSVMVNCVPCINHHYRKAVEEGASKEEIAEAIAICMSISAGNKRAKYTEQINNLEKELKLS